MPTTTPPAHSAGLDPDPHPTTRTGVEMLDDAWDALDGALDDLTDLIGGVLREEAAW